MQFGQQMRRVAYSDSLAVMPAFAYERNDLECGNKILLPPSVLNTVIHGANISPMLFNLQNTNTNTNTFVGVQEFVAPEGCCIVPFWIFNMLKCNEGQQITVTFVPQLSTKKGTLIKIQPHETAFIDLKDPRTVLEKELRNYQALTLNDTINIVFMNREYKIDIVEIKPGNEYNAICVVNSNLSVEFAEPLDYEEQSIKAPDLSKQSSTQVQQKYKEQMRKNSEDTQNKAFTGNVTRIDGKQISTTQMRKELEQLEIKKKQQQELEYDPRKFRIRNGIRKEQMVEHFKGKALKIGQSSFKK